MSDNADQEPCGVIVPTLHKHIKISIDGDAIKVRLADWPPERITVRDARTLAQNLYALARIVDVGGV
jgi:hypothetical protein